jgi:hypothetical protein
MLAEEELEELKEEFKKRLGALDRTVAHLQVCVLFYLWNWDKSFISCL